MNNDPMQGKTILITGGAGSIGSALCMELLNHKPKAIRIVDTHEYSLYRLEKKIDPKHQDVMRYIIADVRDKNRMRRALEGVDIVYHAAAYKHVPICEYNPLEAVQTNVLGTANIVDAAMHNKVEKVVFISTDKAASPTSTLGASKLLGERIITAANYSRGGKLPIFASVRFGNVTMSNGSVIPHFLDLIRNGKPVTVTSPEMTRFLMSLKQAVKLIIEATERMYGGEVFVFKMEAVKIVDLAQALIDMYPHKKGAPKKKSKIIFSKPRPGEKMHEQLVVEDEGERVIETNELLTLLPSLNAPYQKLAHPFETQATPVDTNRFYSYNCLMSPKDIRDFIKKNNIINEGSEVI